MSSLYESLKSARTKYPDTPVFVLDAFVDCDNTQKGKFIEKMCELFDI